MPKPFVWVALDGLTANDNEALSLARHLSESVEGDFGFKVNADWIMKVGFNANPLSLLPKRPIFVDLKLWLGARTMTEILCMVDDAGAAATNMHALAGHSNPTLRDPRALGELTKTITNFRRLRPQSTLRLYAVTVLTHYGSVYCEREFGRRMPEEVLHLVHEARNAGVDGVIMPGTQLATIDAAGMGNILKVFPGTRWGSYADERHEQEIHPAAVRGRDDIELVCGSPITKSGKNPLKALLELFSMIT